jgi:sulfate permease, SulP family
MKLSHFRPRSFELFGNYNAKLFGADLGAGLTVGIVALPLAMAFAIASGAPPQTGIITAVIAGLIISAFGGTDVCIGGPTGAFVVILSTIGMRYGWNDLMVCTIMAGFFLVILGVTGLGKIIKYMPYPVTMGFTSGIAVLIMTTQVKDFFGLTVANVPSEFFEKMIALAKGLPGLSLSATLMSIGTFLFIKFWPKTLQKYFPGTVVAIVLATFVALAFSMPVETIGSRFGSIPQGLPMPSMPHVDWLHIGNLVQPAITIALLAAIESLLCAVVADGMIDGRHNSDQELVAQGVANIACPFFGGIAATSAIARTATNVRAGAKTPVAGIIHAIVLLVILLIAAPYAGYVPLAALSAVLLNVALHMGEWQNFRKLSKWPASDAAVFLSAFVLTVAVDLTVAVEVGVVLAALLFIKRVSETSSVAPVVAGSEEEGKQHSLDGKVIPEGVMVYSMMGALFFGAASKLETILMRTKTEPDVLILRVRKVMAIDATGLNALDNLREKLQKRGHAMVLSAPQAQPLKVMEKSGFVERIGIENICPDIDAALVRANRILAEKRAKRNVPVESAGV